MITHSMLFLPFRGLYFLSLCSSAHRIPSSQSHSIFDIPAWIVLPLHPHLANFSPNFILSGWSCLTPKTNVDSCTTLHFSVAPRSLVSYSCIYVMVSFLLLDGEIGVNEDCVCSCCSCFISIWHRGTQMKE